MIDIIMDPGGVNYAITYIKNNIPVWMGYHPTVPSFQPKNVFSISQFTVVSEILLEKADRLIIERYITRKAARGISPERINLMIGMVLAIACKMDYPPIVITSSSWKRKLDYPELINKWKKIGGLKKDKHFCDCIAMYCIVNEIDPFSFIKKGVPTYNKLKAKERNLKCKNTLPLSKKANHRNQALRTLKS